MNTLAELESFEDEEQLEGAIGNFEIISSSAEGRLRADSTRAETAQDARDYANRRAAAAESNPVAFQATADQSFASLAKIQQENTTLTMQFELMENQKKLLEKDCAEKSQRISTLENDLKELKFRQSELPNLQRQYIELQERVRSIDEQVHKQVSKIEEEFIRVQQSAMSGLEIRERAQVAAATHIRNRQLTVAELQLTTNKLQEANSEIIRLKSVIATLEERVARKTDMNSESCFEE